MENQSHIIITTHGADGACSCALLLQVYPKSEIRITSARRILFTLEDILEQFEKPSSIHICGVGIEENLESVLNLLQALKKKRHKLFWYCGRGYLDSFLAQIHSICRPIFIDCETNTMAIFKHLGLQGSPRIDLLIALAHQYVDPAIQRSEEHAFWHDLIASSATRYFKYEDRQSFIRAIRKLADQIPVTNADREEVETYRRLGKHSGPLGNSKAIQKVRHLIQRLAPLSEPVLILGPTGSGKEVAARLLHEASHRPGLFVAVNCAILSTSGDLAHDRLFGHVSGAYTGAKDSQPGAFEVANRGTLFLDEVAELPLPVQTQLLRVLEEGLITPLGTMKSIAVHVRIVAATNQDLPTLIRERQFRMDLYHRLNVLTLRIPSLLERQEDMKSIANHVHYELNKKDYALRITPADWKAIRQYSWPGNVRQFINLLKRAAYMEMSVREVLNEELRETAADDRIAIPRQAWKEYHQFRPESQDEVLPVEEIRRSYTQHVLALFDGNITHAADALEVSINTLKKWIKET